MHCSILICCATPSSFCNTGKLKKCTIPDSGVRRVFLSMAVRVEGAFRQGVRLEADPHRRRHQEHRHEAPIL